MLNDPEIKMFFKLDAKRNNVGLTQREQKAYEALSDLYHNGDPKYDDSKHTKRPPRPREEGQDDYSAFV